MTRQPRRARRRFYRNARGLLPTQRQRTVVSGNEQVSSGFEEKAPLMRSSCAAPSPGSIFTCILCCPERTAMIWDRLPCIGRNDTEFLSCGAGDSAVEGEVAVYPE
jgi:hypothetical protein